MLSKGGNIDFPLGQVVNKSILLLLLFISTISSQTLLNNFGISDIVKTYNGYTEFRILDFNKDGIDDLFLFGNQEKNFVLHKGNNNSTFDKPIRKFFFFPIDDIQWFAKSEKGEDYYIFVSRKKRLVGLVSFTKNFAFRLLHTIEYNSYPSSIVVTDIDDDGINDAFVFGSNFNGIVKVNNDGYRLSSEMILDQSVFSDLIIKDFNQDEVKDIITIDVLNNSLAFIENTEINGFTYGREIAIDEELFSLDEFDYNLDGFSDLVVSKTDGQQIFLGDSVNSYSKNQKVELDFIPYKSIFEDLNNDAIVDHISINSRDDKAIFRDGYNIENDNYNFNLNGISDISMHNRNNKKSLILLSKLGKIQIISNENKWNNDFSFSVNGSARNLKYLEGQDSLFSSLIFDNGNENSINIFKIDTSGNFIESKKKQFQNSFTNYDNSDDLAYFVVSTKGSRLLEIINRYGLEIDQSYVYAKFPIHQVLFDSTDISVLEMEDNYLYYETITFNDGNYNTEKNNFIDSSVVSSHIFNNSIYYWKKVEKELTLNSYKDTTQSRIFSITDTTLMKSNPIFIKNNNVLLSILSQENKNVVYLLNGENINDYTIELDFDLSQMQNEQIKFYDSFGGDKILLINDNVKNEILLYKFDDKKKSIVLSNSIDALESNDYFVQNFFGINYLVYSDKNNSCLTFKVLD